MECDLRVDHVYRGRHNKLVLIEDGHPRVLVPARDLAGSVEAGSVPLSRVGLLLHKDLLLTGVGAALFLVSGENGQLQGS